jgi:hypothetical protein
VLKRYYCDAVVALTLLMLVLATNAIQYISVDNAQSHGYLFALYSLVLWATIKWHEAPRIRHAVLIGAIIGLAAVARPTEAIMLFIPVAVEHGFQNGSKSEVGAGARLSRTHCMGHGCRVPDGPSRSWSIGRS